MASNRLSAEELMKYFKGLVAELPQKGGPKEYKPDGSWLQAKQLECFYKERHNVLSEERVKKKGHLAHAEWRPELGLVEIIGKVGKFWQTTGHVEGGRYFLYPEEALGLVDKGDIEVYYGNMPLSVQECYPTLLGDEIPIEHYQVYIHLSRLGYVVFRHQPVERLSAYEQKIGLNRITQKRAPKRKKKKTEMLRLEEKVAKTEDMEINVLDHQNSLCTENDNQRVVQLMDSYPSDSEQSEKDTSQIPCNHELMSWICSNSTEGLNSEHLHKKLAHSDFSDISFPSLVPGFTCEMERPKLEYLPKGIVLHQERYTLRSPRYTPAPKSYSTQGELEFSYTRSSGRNTLKARNWTEYKEQLKQMSEEDALLQSPVGHLWKGSVTPLIKPSEAHSTASLLERIKVIQNVNFADDVKSYPDTVRSDVKIIFDVYKSKGQFSKTSPGLPAFRLCIKRQDDPCISLADMIQVSRLSPDGVPVQWAVVDNGDLTFYSFQGVDLPTDTTLDWKADNTS